MPEKTEQDDIITGDEIPSLPDFVENGINTNSNLEIEKLKSNIRNNQHYDYNSYSNFGDNEIRPGFLDINYTNKGRVKKNRNNRKLNFRFMQKSMSGQDEDFFNKDSGATDPNYPTREIEMIRKDGVSNGIILVNKKRICNFETSKYPEYYMDLRKD